MDIIAKAREIRSRLDVITNEMTDNQAAQSTVLFKEWSGDGVKYEAGQRLNYNETLYKVIQAHTSQSDWTPDVATSLYAKVLIVDENTISAWQQPDSTNPYMKGDKVTHNDKTWISTVDNNVWEPSVYGWEEV